MRRKHLYLALFMLVLMGCEDDQSNSDLSAIKTLIEQKRELWSSNQLSDYQFSYSVIPGDCPTADSLPTVEISVEDNKVVSVYIPNQNEYVEVATHPTIDDVFTIMLSRLTTKPKQYSASKTKKAYPEFDSNLHFPTQFFIDQSSEDCDAFQTNINDFK